MRRAPPSPWRPASTRPATCTTVWTARWPRPPSTSRRLHERHRRQGQRPPRRRRGRPRGHRIERTVRRRLRRARRAGALPGRRCHRGRELLDHGGDPSPRRRRGIGACGQMGDPRLRRRHQTGRPERHGPRPGGDPRRHASTRVDHGSPSRSRICMVRRRRAAPKWAGHGSTRCGFPAMW